MIRIDIPLPLPAELTLTALKRTAHSVLRARVTPGSVVYLLAHALAWLRLRSAALPLYDLALFLADRSSSRRTFLVRQEWQFAAEKTRHSLGTARVVDPLFRVSATPVPSSTPNYPRSYAPGYYEVRVTHRGLRIDGFLRVGTPGRRVDVLIDDVLVRQTTASRLMPGLYLFVVRLQRDALQAMPRSSRLTLRDADGKPLLNLGRTETQIAIPHGTGDSPVSVDKKGFLVRSSADNSALQQGFLATYSAAMRFYERAFGTPLFLLYGTLLGMHRNGDFIPGDDDFDVGYWSDATSSKEVRSEGVEMATQLVRAGFVVTVNRSGRLFRLRLPGMPPACHLDVHSVWKECGRVWIHPQANLGCQRKDFLPASAGFLRGAPVNIPARPEAFLAAYYGADWRVPNPAYSTASRRFPIWQERKLRRSLITPALARQVRLRIGSDPEQNHGKFIAIGTESIYPLDEYERDCDW